MKRCGYLFFYLLLSSSMLFAQKGRDHTDFGVAKVACTPCEDYYGYGSGPAAQALVIVDSVPGLLHFVHSVDPDTGTIYLYSQFGFVHDSTNITAYPGDTISVQFPHNGVYEVYHNAYYQVPAGICQHWGHFFVTVTGIPFAAITAAPEALDPAPSNAAIAYPNPVGNTLSVAWDHPDANKATVILYNLAGQMVLQNLRFEQGLLQVDMQNLAHGCYEMVLTSGKTVQHMRVLRQ